MEPTEPTEDDIEVFSTPLSAHISCCDTLNKLQPPKKKVLPRSGPGLLYNMPILLLHPLKGISTKSYAKAACFETLFIYFYILMIMNVSYIVLGCF